MPNLFISYRRIDSAPEAGRLSDALQRVMGRRPVFRDVDSLAPGEIFASEIDRSIGGADTVIVLIGPLWIGELQRRLGLNTTDFVRQEVASALRLNKRVIPVLLRGAELPDPHDLPDDLSTLPQHNALRLRDDESWEAGLQRLIEAVGRPIHWGFLLARGLASLCLAVLVAWLGLPVVIPESGVGEARLTILAFLAGWILVECGHWYRRRGRR